jgi:hypothetical protein
MSRFKKIILSLSILFFVACGTENDTINPDLGFDMWDYMTSSRNYEVEYDVYENGLRTDYYVETHRILGDIYERESNTGVTRITRSSNRLIMHDPQETTIINQFTHVGDKGVFQSPSIHLCTLENFYPSYHTRGSQFYNVIQVNCQYKSGFYQEFYYGYNEGIVHIYSEDHGNITEYVKVSEKEIF